MARYWQSRAVEPISQFVPLPLDLLGAQVGQRQQERDILDQQLQADSSLGVRYVPSMYGKQSPDELKVLKLESDIDDRVEALRDRFMTEDDIKGITKELVGIKRDRENLLKQSGEAGRIQANRDIFDAQMKALDESKFEAPVRDRYKKQLYYEFINQGGTAFDPKTQQANRYRELDIPEYENLYESLFEVGKEMDPTKVAEDLGWTYDQQAGVFRNAKGSVESLPASYIKNVLKQAAISDPRLKDNLDFIKGAFGTSDEGKIQGQAFIDDAVNRAATNLGNVFRQYKYDEDTDIKFPPEYFATGAGGFQFSRDSQIVPVSQTARLSGVDIPEDQMFKDGSLQLIGTGQELSGSTIPPGESKPIATYKQVVTDRDRNDYKQTKSIIDQVRIAFPRTKNMTDQEVYNLYQDDATYRSSVIPVNYEAQSNAVQFGNTGDVFTGAYSGNRNFYIKDVDDKEREKLTHEDLLELYEDEDWEDKFFGEDITKTNVGWQISYDNPEGITYTRNFGDKAIEMIPNDNVVQFTKPAHELVQTNLTFSSLDRFKSAGLAPGDYGRAGYEQFIINTSEGRNVIYTDPDFMNQIKDQANTGDAIIATLDANDMLAPITEYVTDRDGNIIGERQVGVSSLPKQVEVANEFIRKNDATYVKQNTKSVNK